MLLISEIAALCRVPAHRVRYWERFGLRVGGRGYEHHVFLESRSLDGLFAFIREAWTHPSMKDLPFDLIAAAFRSGDEPVPARFIAPPSPVARRSW